MSFFGVQLNAQINKLNLQVRLNLSKNKHSPNFRTLYKSFFSFDKQATGLVSADNFEQALNKNGLFFKKFQLQAYQKAYDQNGQVSWFAFLNGIREPMNQKRRDFINDVFTYLDTEKLNAIHYTKLMKSFNPQEFQEFKQGKKSKEILERELIALVNLQPDGQLTRQQFVGFYDDLNINIPGDTAFFLFVSTTWGFKLEKQDSVELEQVAAAIKLIRFKLIQKTQGTNDEFLLRKVFNEFDFGKEGALRLQDLQLMLIKLEAPVEPKLLNPVFSKFDKNGSGLIEYNQFKNFLFFDPYPI